MGKWIISKWPAGRGSGSQATGRRTFPGLRCLGTGSGNGQLRESEHFILSHHIYTNRIQVKFVASYII